MIKLRAMMRSGFLTKTEEAKNKGTLSEAEAALDAALVFVGGGQFFCREVGGIEPIGANNETRLTLHLLFHTFLANADLGLEVPDGRDRSRLLTRSSFGCITELSHHLALDLQPRGQFLLFPLQGGHRISFAGEVLMAQMPEPLCPGGSHFLRSAVHLRLRLCFARLTSAR